MYSWIYGNIIQAPGNQFTEKAISITYYKRPLLSSIVMIARKVILIYLRIPILNDSREVLSIRRSLLCPRITSMRCVLLINGQEKSSWNLPCQLLLLCTSCIQCLKETGSLLSPKTELLSHGPEVGKRMLKFNLNRKEAKTCISYI